MEARDEILGGARASPMRAFIERDPLADEQRDGRRVAELRGSARSQAGLCYGPAEEGDTALADGLNLLGIFYGALSPAISPEASAHLETADLRVLDEN